MLTAYSVFVDRPLALQFQLLMTKSHLQRQEKFPRNWFTHRSISFMKPLNVHESTVHLTTRNVYFTFKTTSKPNEPVAGNTSTTNKNIITTILFLECKNWQRLQWHGPHMWLATEGKLWSLCACTFRCAAASAAFLQLDCILSTCILT